MDGRRRFHPTLRKKESWADGFEDDGENIWSVQKRGSEGPIFKSHHQHQHYTGQDSTTSSFSLFGLIIQLLLLIPIIRLVAVQLSLVKPPESVQAAASDNNNKLYVKSGDGNDGNDGEMPDEMPPMERKAILKRLGGKKGRNGLPNGREAVETWG
jgi:hypothetical protein